MKTETLLDALDDLDPKLVEEALAWGEQYGAKRRERRRRVFVSAGIAAAAALVFVSVLLIWNRPGTGLVDPINNRREDEPYYAQIVKFDGSVPEIDTKIIGVETELNYGGMYQDETMPEQFEVTVLGETYIGTYAHSTYFFGCYEPRHYYRGGRNEFAIDQDGTLLSFVWGRDVEVLPGKNDLPEDEYIQKARELITNIRQIDLTNYVPVCSYCDGLLFVAFYKYLNGIQTYDYAHISFNPDGTPFNFVSQMFGKLPSEVDCTFDLDEAKGAVIKRCDELCEEAKKVYDTVEYVDWQIRLSIDENGRFFLVTYVRIACASFNEGYGPITSYEENINFLQYI